MLSHLGSKALREQAGKLISAFSNESLCGLTPILVLLIAQSWIRFLLTEEKKLVSPLKSVWLGG